MWLKFWYFNRHHEKNEKIIHTLGEIFYIKYLTNTLYSEYVKNACSPIRRRQKKKKAQCKNSQKTQTDISLKNA